MTSDRAERMANPAGDDGFGVIWWLPDQPIITSPGSVKTYIITKYSNINNWH